MDKTLEIIMVAVALLIAVVIVTSLLQGQSDRFGTFASNQTSSSSCSIETSKFQNAIDCPCSSSGCTAGPQASAIYQANKNSCFSSYSDANGAKSSFC